MTESREPSNDRANPATRPDATVVAIRRTHAWFEAHSGWAEPTRDALEEWFGDDVCQCPDECWVAIDGVCEHGLASWWLVLRAMGEHESLTAVARQRLLQHAPNFRDVHGVRTADGRELRPGIVYRSGVLDALDSADLSRMRALGIKTVIDLRSSGEVVQRPNQLPDDVVTHHVAVHDVSAAPLSILERIESGETEGLGASMLIAGNIAFATTHRTVFADVLSLLTDPQNWPVVVHCTAGKDRTGFAIATLLWALEIDTDDVIDDYTRTNAALADRHEAIIVQAKSRGIDTTVLEAMLCAEPSYLMAGYETAVHEYGSIDAWLRDALGIDGAMRRDWQRDMLTASKPAE